MSSKLTTIPSEAIEWMTKKVTNFKIDREDMVSRLTRFGLSTLIGT